jgi:hypothetical protein
MKEAGHFINYFKDSLEDGVAPDLMVSKGFFADFIQYTPEIEQALYHYLRENQMNLFYSRLNDLKYLCVFNEELNKYWFAMRALSGALDKLQNPTTLGNAQKVHQYYVEKYGDRRLLKDENWFEHRRWTFLDALKSVNTEEHLSDIIEQNLVVLSGLLDIYKHHLSCFILKIKHALIEE